MPWAKLDDKFHDNRKIRRVWRRCPEALGLHVLAMTYCAAHLTDGLVDHDFVDDRAPTARACKRMTDALVEAELWHAVDGGWQIHDFTEFNGTRADIERRRRARRDAGRMGAAARWDEDTETDGKSHGKSHGNRMSTSCDSEDACHFTEMHPTRPQPIPTRNASANADASLGKEQAKASEQDRANCRTFAELVRQRNPKAKMPQAGTDAHEGWFREMRLMRERDGNSADEIAAVIRWLFTAEHRDAVFWGTTVQAPSGLRSHYPQIHAKMLAARKPSEPAVAGESLDSLLDRRGVDRLIAEAGA